MKQREANKEALKFALELIKMQDLETIFPGKSGESFKQDDILERAQQYAANRIAALMGMKP